MDKTCKLLDQIKEWDRLADITQVAEFRALCRKQRLEAVQELLELRTEWQDRVLQGKFDHVRTG
mgnify:CR=1 FL=1